MRFVPPRCKCPARGHPNPTLHVRKLLFLKRVLKLVFGTRLQFLNFKAFSYRARTLISFTTRYVLPTPWCNPEPRSKALDSVPKSVFMELLHYAREKIMIESRHARALVSDRSRCQRATSFNAGQAFFCLRK
jgi:hypothetical protein